MKTIEQLIAESEDPAAYRRELDARKPYISPETRREREKVQRAHGERIAARRAVNPFS